MGCLLSIDWDYFIFCKEEEQYSFLENSKNIIDIWYKKYIAYKEKGENINNYYSLSKEVDNFFEKIKSKFIISNNTNVYVSDSHKLSYYISKNYKCDTVYLFDAHSDLGYGDDSTLDFEVNCANWLGKLLKDKYIKKAYIIYSPYTLESPNLFKNINKLYNIKYVSFENIKSEINVSAIHISRSGAWTPPWLDKNFFEFIEKLNLPYKLINCPIRKWNPKKI